MTISHDRKEKTVHTKQGHSFKEIWDRRIDECWDSTEPNQKLSGAAEEERGKFSHLPYQCLVRSLMYPTVCTRPDIAHVTSTRSQFNTSFTEEHWKTAKTLLRYLKWTVNQNLVYKGTGKDIVGYVDTD
jgi:hypothetical protein